MNTKVPATASREGQRRILTTMEEVRDATVQVASMAQRNIAIYTPDLEPDLYDHAPFLDAVKRLVLAKPYAKVRVLISEPQRANRNGSLLIAVGRRLNTVVDFRNVKQEYREQYCDAYIIADDNSLMYRADATRWDGMLGTHEPAVIQRHMEIFNEIWEASAYSREVQAAYI